METFHAARRSAVLAGGQWRPCPVWLIKAGAFGQAPALRSFNREGFVVYLIIQARLAGRAANHVAQLIKFDEVVALAAQLIRNHRRVAADGRDDRDPHALPLQAFDQRAEIAVTRKNDDDFLIPKIIN